MALNRMGSGFVLLGEEKVLLGLAREVMGYRRRSVAGMHEAVQLVERHAKINCPVDTSTLVNSCQTKVFNRPSGPVGRIEFTANYALWVHEINKNYRVGGWKYLERALSENGAQVLDLIGAKAEG